MNILFFCSNDFAGVIWSLYNAIKNHYPEHKVHMVRVYPHQYEYPTEYEYSKLTPEQLAKLFDWADIWHFSEIYAPPVKEQDMAGRRILTHVHGFSFRSQIPVRNKLKSSLEKGWFKKILVSTPDLLKFKIEGSDSNLYQYLPNPFPEDNPLYTPNENKTWDSIRIHMAPFNASMKNLPAIVKAVNHLALKQYPVNLELTMNTSHLECLKIKRNCHMLFDSIARVSPSHDFEAVSMGVNGIEAQAMGLPVFVKLDPVCALPEFTRRTKEVGMEKIPMILVEEENLEEKIEYYLQDYNRIKELGKYAREWITKTHGSRVVAKELINIYNSLEPF